MSKIKNTIFISAFIIVVCCLAVLTLNYVNNKDSEENIDIASLYNQTLVQDIQLEPGEDYDKDGLSNEKEQSLSTNPYSVDTDNDMLTDGEEISNGTNPLNSDSDSDGLDDGIELIANLNPLNAVSDGVTDDKNRKFEHNITSQDKQCSLSASGNAQCYSISIDKLNNTGMENVPGVVSSVYSISMLSDALDGLAQISIKYNTDIVNIRNYDEDNLSVYELKEDNSWKKVAPKKKKSNEITIERSVPAKLFIADDNILGKSDELEIYFLLDNSGSMYSEEVFEGSDANDPDFKRVTFSQQLISKIGDKATYGAGKFTASFKDLGDGVGHDGKTITEKLETIKTIDESFTGTVISRSLRDAANLFDAQKASKKFIILLTDGTQITTGGVSTSQAANLCKEKGISVINIALGNDCDSTFLQELANPTGGITVFAKDADALDKVYDIIMNAIDNTLVDTDKDGIPDAKLIADNSFDVKKDGFSFSNYPARITMPNGKTIVTGGQCYGMSSVVQLYYENRLPVIGGDVPMHGKKEA